MDTTTAPRFRYVGCVDDTNTCEKCGRVELKSVVVIQPLDADGNADGDVVYYGSTCAARALAVRGGGRAVLQAARGARWRAHSDAQDARRMLAHYGLPETGEPTADALATARRLYVRNHTGLAERCARTGTTVTAMVLDMLARKQAALATATLLKINVDAHLDY